MIVFDIETGPLARDAILASLPPFDPESVKTGNLGPEKAAAKAKFAEEDYYTKAVERAALSPLTGQVLAIGYLASGAPSVLDVVGNENGFTESLVIEHFWLRCRKAIDDNERLIGHNIFGFDLPFLLRRSWILGIEVPDGVIHGRHLSDRLFRDTMQIWGCGTRDSFVSLDTLVKAFGVGGKPEGVHGGMFAGLLETDRKAALDYLRNDLEMTAAVAAKMGLY